MSGLIFNQTALVGGGGDRQNNTLVLHVGSCAWVNNPARHIKKKKKKKTLVAEKSTQTSAGTVQLWEASRELRKVTREI